MELLSREKIVQLTSQNPYERSEDGRPRVPDDILKRMEKVTTEEAWGAVGGHDYHFQYDGDWVNLHPERILVGRAVTCRYVPHRPDLNAVVEQSEAIRMRDYFGKMRIREGVYTPGEVDRGWSDEMNADFEGWKKTTTLDDLDV